MSVSTDLNVIGVCYMYFFMCGLLILVWFLLHCSRLAANFSLFSQKFKLLIGLTVEYRLQS